MDTALVTGASSGIGAAMARRLAADGHAVLALGRNPDRMAALEGIANLRPLACDITDRAALAAALEGVAIDILVNNAGIMPPLAPFHAADQEDLDRAIAVNLTAQIALTRLVVPGMVARGRGHVVFTGSTAGHAPFANLAAYCATKAGLGGFAQALRLDLAPHGVRVTEIVAGRIETGLYRDILPDAARARMYEGGTAVQPEDVAVTLATVLALPAHATVARFDILPTRQGTASGDRT